MTYLYFSFEFLHVFLFKTSIIFYYRVSRDLLIGFWPFPRIFCPIVSIGKYPIGKYQKLMGTNQKSMGYDQKIEGTHQKIMTDKS